MISNVPLNSVKEPRKRDNPLINQISIKTAFSLINGLCTLHKDLGISMTDMLLLVVLHKSWSVDGQGLNVNELCEAMDYRSEYWSHVRRRVVRLKSLDMVDIVGTGHNSCVLYATSKSMNKTMDAYYLSKL